MTYTCPPLAILCLCAQGRFGETNMAGGGLSICTPACNGSSLCSDRLRSFSFSAAWLELLLALYCGNINIPGYFLEVFWYLAFLTLHGEICKEMAQEEGRLFWS